MIFNIFLIIKRDSHLQDEFLTVKYDGESLRFFMKKRSILK